jgi:soluble lytic murein transglycosylase
MPKVPLYDNFQTSVSGAPNVRAQASSEAAPIAVAPGGPQAGAIAAEQASQFGQAATRTGQDIGRIAQDMQARATQEQDRADQVRVNAARNQLSIATQDLAYNKESGFLTRKGASAFLDAQGKPLEKPLDQDYSEKLKAAIDDIGSGLGTEAQRRAFGMHAGDVAAQFHGQLQSHTLQQFNAYSDAEDESRVRLDSNTAALNWNNPDVVAASVRSADAAIRRKAERAGLVGAPFEAAVLAGNSAIHENVILTALQNNNPSYAMGYLAAHKKEMAANDILKVQGHITEADALQQAQGAVAKQTVAVMPALAPNSFDRMAQITAMSESGNREFNKDGSVVTSPKGALGSMQVMPATAANPGFGMKPLAPNATPEQRAQFGRDYLQKLLGMYGTPDKAWAAYNAGPGALDKALKAATISHGGPDSWIGHMPQETQAYVAKNMRALGSNTALAPRPTELEFVTGALSQLGANATPQAIKHTREAATRQFSTLNKSLTEKGDNALADAQRWVLENNASSLAQLPPQLKDALTQFAPGRMDDLDRFAKAQGVTVTNDSLYLKLATSPDMLTSLTDAQFRNLRTDLSEADFKHFANARALKLKGGASTNPGELNVQAINDTLKERFRALKMDATPKDGSDEAVQQGTVHRFVRDQLSEAQRNAGKKFNDVETAKFIDGLFAKNVTFKGFFGGENSQSLLTLKPGDVPSEVRKALKADFAKVGIASPTDSDILGAYIRLKSAQKASQ